MTEAKFLVDENYLGKPAVSSLHTLGQTRVPKAAFTHFLDKFESSTPDREWLNELASEGYLIITADRARRGGGGAGNKLTNLCRELSITHVLVTHSIHRARLSHASRSGIIPGVPPIPMIDKSRQSSKPGTTSCACPPLRGGAASYFGSTTGDGPY